MSSISRRILTVGLSAPANTVLERLARKGWQSHVVQTLQDAEAAVRSGSFRVILATEVLADGSGYELVESVAGSGGTLLIAITLSEGYLWLPVVESGTRTLGDCGLDPQMLELEIEGFADSGRQRTSLWGESGAADRRKSSRAKTVGHAQRIHRESGLELDHR